MKLILFLIENIYEIKKRISKINQSVSPCLSLPRANISCRIWRGAGAGSARGEKKSGWKGRKRKISNNLFFGSGALFYLRLKKQGFGLVQLLTRSYWMKYKFGVSWYRSKKNFFYVSGLGVSIATTRTISSTSLPTFENIFYLIHNRAQRGEHVSTGFRDYARHVTLTFWFYLLSFVNKRHRQYKHLILNTIIKYISSFIYIKINKQISPFGSINGQDFALPSSCVFFLQNNSPETFKGMLSFNELRLQLLLAHFQLCVEFLHFILYFYSLPFDFFYFPSISYFCLTSLNSFEPSGSLSSRLALLRVVASPTPRFSVSRDVDGSSWQLKKTPKSIDAHLDLQLPKLRKSSYRRTSLLSISLNSPSWRPLGFMLRRHSLFFPPCHVGSSFWLRLPPNSWDKKAYSPQNAFANLSPRAIFEQFPLFDPRIHQNLRSCWVDNPHFSLSVRFHSSKAYNASTFVHNLSRFAIAFLKKSNRGKNKLQQLKNSVFSILRLLSSQRLGVGFQFSGRIYGAKKASSFKILLGSVPLNTLDAFIDYSSIMQKTRNGTWGFKVWLRHDLTTVGCFDSTIVSSASFFLKKHIHKYASPPFLLRV